MVYNIVMIFVILISLKMWSSTGGVSPSLQAICMCILLLRNGFKIFPLYLQLMFSYNFIPLHEVGRFVIFFFTLRMYISILEHLKALSLEIASTFYLILCISCLWTSTKCVVQYLILHSTSSLRTAFEVIFLKSAFQFLHPLFIYF